jgi:hypothetical protein
MSRSGEKKSKWVELTFPCLPPVPPVLVVKSLPLVASLPRCAVAGLYLHLSGRAGDFSVSAHGRSIIVSYSGDEPPPARDRPGYAVLDGTRLRSSQGRVQGCPGDELSPGRSTEDWWS